MKRLAIAIALVLTWGTFLGIQTLNAQTLVINTLEELAKPAAGKEVIFLVNPDIGSELRQVTSEHQQALALAKFLADKRSIGIRLDQATQTFYYAFTWDPKAKDKTWREKLSELDINSKLKDLLEKVKS